MDLKMKKIVCAIVAAVLFLSFFMTSSEASRHSHGKCDPCPFTMRLDEDINRNPRYIIRISCYGDFGGRPCQNVTEERKDIGTVVVGCKVQELQQIPDTNRFSN